MVPAAAGEEASFNPFARPPQRRAGLAWWPAHRFGAAAPNDARRASQARSLALRGLQLPKRSPLPYSLVLVGTAMALFWRIWAVVTVVNLAVLTIFVGLATLQFDDIHSGLVGERLEVLADRTAAPFAAAARIGLPLSGVRNAAALLERARQTDDSITAIHVFDAEGRIVQSTETSPPATIPPEALAARRAADGGRWHRETSEGFLGSIDIAGRGDTSAGGILVVYPPGGNITRVWAMAAELSLVALGVILVAAALSGVLLRLGLGREIGAFDAVDNAIGAFERDSWRSAAAHGPPTPVEDATDDLRRLLDAAETRYRAAGQVIASGPRDAA